METNERTYRSGTKIFISCVNAHKKAFNAKYRMASSVHKTLQLRDIKPPQN